MLSNLHLPEESSAVRWLKTEDEIEISIKDTGIGISKKMSESYLTGLYLFLIQICKTAAELVCRLSANWSICIKEKLKWIAK